MEPRCRKESRRVGKGAGAAFPCGKACRAPCPRTALKRAASPVVGTAHESLHLWQWLCQRLCPPYIRALVELPYLQPRRAFELTFGELCRQLWIGAALARLAVE